MHHKDERLQYQILMNTLQHRTRDLGRISFMKKIAKTKGSSIKQPTKTKELHKDLLISVLFSSKVATKSHTVNFLCTTLYMTETSMIVEETFQNEFLKYLIIYSL